MDGGGENAFPSLVALKILKGRKPQTARLAFSQEREKLKLSELPRVSHVTVEEGYPTPGFRLLLECRPPWPCAI